MTTYTDLLRDPRWQRKRLGILSRDNFTCQFCEAATRPLHVHHRYYKSGWKPWDYPDESLLTLCEICHAGETEHLKKAKGELFLSLAEHGHTALEILLLAHALRRREFFDAVSTLVQAELCFMDLALMRDLIQERFERYLTYEAGA